MPLTFNPVLFCEDIRKEDNGKHLFIGVYPEGVYAHSFPANLRFSLWVTATTQERENEVEFQVVIAPTSGGKREVKILGPMRIEVSEEKFNPKGTKVSFAITGLTLSFEEESEFIVRARLKGGRWKKISSIPVTAQA